jgi:GT2 family glycosyltransferase
MQEIGPLPTRSPTISLVIPNWNGLAHLADCLDSVHAQTMQPTETIIVDNGSSDGSVEFVMSRYPWAMLIALASNAGVGVALNRGIAASKGEFVALLNNDIALSPRWLETMVAALESEPAAGSIACKMVKFFDRGRIDAAGDFLTRAGSPYTRGSDEPDDGRYRLREFVFGACGAAALYRRSMLNVIGTFDEDFIAYYEDVDLSFRAQLADYRCLYVPDAVCYHKRGATYGKVSGFAIRMQERNLTALYIKNFPTRLLMKKMLMIMASRVRRLYRSAKVGVGRPALAGLWEGLRATPLMLRKRRAIQQMRKVPLEHLGTFMKAKP